MSITKARIRDALLFFPPTDEMESQWIPKLFFPFVRPALPRKRTRSKQLWFLHRRFPCLDSLVQPEERPAPNKAQFPF